LGGGGRLGGDVGEEGVFAVVGELEKAREAFGLLGIGWCGQRWRFRKIELD